MHAPGAVLPLHDALGTRRARRVGDGAVVGFLVEAIVGEGVGYARLVGLDEFVGDGVVEALRGSVVSVRTGRREIEYEGIRVL